MSKLMFENFGDHCGAIKKLGDVPVVNIAKDDINDCQFQEDVLIEGGGVVIHKNVLEFTEELGLMHKKFGETFPSQVYEPITVPLHMEPMNYDSQNFSPYS